MTFIAVQCPHCLSEQIVKRGKTHRGTQRYLCQNTACARGSFLGSLVICVTRVFSRISLIFKRIVNIPRGQAGYVGTGDLDSKYRSSVV